MFMKPKKKVFFRGCYDKFDFYANNIKFFNNSKSNLKLSIKLIDKHAYILFKN